MRSGKRVFYWDSCLFIAWMADEKRSPGEMEGLAEVVAMVDAQECYILTSVNTRGEVLDSTLTVDARDKFRDLFYNPFFAFADVSLPISELAGQIRDFYRAHRPPIKVSLPDATHLARAIAYKEVDEFHTFDEEDLIRFNGSVAGHRLRISKPSAIQKRLFP